MAMPASSGGSGFGGAYSGYGGGNVIQGNLPFQSSLGGGYAGAYQSALNQNKQNYQNVLAGYQQTMQQQQSQQANVAQGYTNLYQSILGELQGSNTAQQQLINRQYDAQRGAQSQSLINRGLGNTTVQSAVDRGLSMDQSLAQNANAQQFAQLQAGYHNQIGLASQAYQGDSINRQVGLAGQQLDFMNSVSAPYPNAGMYAQIAAMNGQNDNPYGKGGIGGIKGGAGGMTVNPSRFGGFSGPSPQYGVTPPQGGVGGYDPYWQGSSYVPTTPNQTPYINEPLGYSDARAAQDYLGGSSWNPANWSGSGAGLGSVAGAWSGLGGGGGGGGYDPATDIDLGGGYYF